VSLPGPLSQRAIILAPSGRDAEIAALILKEAAFSANICGDLPRLCEEIVKGAGLGVIADEATRGADLLDRSPTS
jgi:hypothetical protein